MTNRQRFFTVLEGNCNGDVPFYPDITDWYCYGRTPPGEDATHVAGTYTPDGIPLHGRRGTLPEQFDGWTHMDFHRRFGWGLPVHGYGWYAYDYRDAEETTRREGNTRTVTLRGSAGTLTRRYQRAADGSWCPTVHYAHSVTDLKILQRTVAGLHWRPRYDVLERILQGIGDLGVVDVPLPRSPFGKLVHEYMGFENVIYALADEESAVLDFLAVQEEKDLELVRLAAASPAKIVIMSDHADENLISPRDYARFCIPYYQKIADILHPAGKIISTHLDGNFKGFFPLLKETGFDLLDGCTPFPMTNWTPEELARAMPAGMCCYCGVAATLFTQNLPDEVILTHGKRIIDALAGRLILNVGDILPAGANIQQVVRLGELASVRNSGPMMT